MTVCSMAAGMRLDAPLRRRAAVFLPPLAAMFQPQTAAAGETIRDVAIKLEKELRSTGANSDPYWNESKPTLSQQGGSPTAICIQLAAPPDSGAEYVWVRKVLPTEVISIVSVKKVKPGAAAVVSVTLPYGKYRAALYSRDHGFWEGQDFTVQ